MNPRMVSAEDLGLQTAKILAEAEKAPVLIKVKGRPTLVLRHLADDDLVDDLIVSNKRFRASVRRARRQIQSGKSVSLAEARRRLLR